MGSTFTTKLHRDSTTANRITSHSTLIAIYHSRYATLGHNVAARRGKEGPSQVNALLKATTEQNKRLLLIALCVYYQKKECCQ
jgi:hypothetical protein